MGDKRCRHNVCLTFSKRCWSDARNHYIVAVWLLVESVKNRERDFPLVRSIRINLRRRKKGELCSVIYV